MFQSLYFVTISVTEFFLSFNLLLKLCILKVTLNIFKEVGKSIGYKEWGIEKVRMNKKICKNKREEMKEKQS